MCSMWFYYNCFVVMILGMLRQGLQRCQTISCTFFTKCGAICSFLRETLPSCSERSASVDHGTWTRGKRGSKYGYFANPAKVWLVVKECRICQSKFQGGVNVTTNGKVYLGSFIGPFVEGKVECWSAELEVPTIIANTQPLFCAFIDWIVKKWWHLFRATGQVEVNIEDHDRSSLHATSPVTVAACPAFSDNEHDVLSLLTRMEGL